MNICRACNRAVDCEEYCVKCEAEIKAHEVSVEERGFAIPVQVVCGPRSVWIEDESGLPIVLINNIEMKLAIELAKVIAASIKDYYD